MVPQLLTLLALLRDRWDAIREDDQGSFSLEQAVIAAALLALAIGLAAVLVSAVSNHESSIK